jgi:hypothetical protein
VTRAAIVAALGTVPGITPKATIGGPISPGDAWPVWRSSVWLNRCLTETTWDVLVALPDAGADVTAAEGDPLVPLVGEALMAAGCQVVQVEPARTAVTENSPGTPVLRYQVRTN